MMHFQPSFGVRLHRGGLASCSTAIVVWNLLTLLILAVPGWAEQTPTVVLCLAFPVFAKVKLHSSLISVLHSTQT
jgi:hypothetical protein